MHEKPPRAPAPRGEKVLPGPGHSFAMERWKVPVLTCAYHTHPEFEITLVDGGHGSRLIGDHLGAYGEGDLVLIGSGLPHLYHGRAEDSRSPTWARSYAIKFAPHCFGPDFFELPELRPVRALLGRSSRGLSFPPATRMKAAA
ncbi:MAG: AraC family ligand binding domain-containing protein [Spirochaetes bacterium]|nr:AraC family ligand binding domain-containing protein [Spirochaetota bacterium]